MSELYYPLDEEVNDLLGAAETAGLERSDEYRALIFAARGCKAEATAYAALLERMG